MVCISLKKVAILNTDSHHGIQHCFIERRIAQAVHTAVKRYGFGIRTYMQGIPNYHRISCLFMQKTAILNFGNHPGIVLHLFNSIFELCHSELVIYNYLQFSLTANFQK